ncbi:hypothetical protein ACFLYP_00610 [Chloroflexota bacterium]
MKILVFLHGTTIMHKSALGVSRIDRVKQVEDQEKSVRDFASYVPIGGAVDKLQKWKDLGAEILYLSSHKNIEDVDKDRQVLKKFNFPEGQVLFRQKGQAYKEVAETIAPDVLIEDDCESIGGKDEMTITFVKPEIKAKIKSIPVKEFGGIDHLPDNISELLDYRNLS